jgi:oligopeptidase B
MKTPKPPVARASNKTSRHHGITLEDPYDWLYDRAYPELKNKEVLEYLKAENAYTKAVMAPYKDFSETLFREMKGRIAEQDEGVPARDGPYLYSWRYSGGSQYKVWFRNPADGGNEEIILDENARAKGKEYYRLGGLAVSPDHSLLAWSEDFNGSERFTYRIKNLKTGEIFAEEISETIGQSVWSSDGQYLFYTVVDENWRPYEIRRHKIGAPVNEDVVVYAEPDPGFFLSVSRTHSREFIVINAATQVTSEIYVFPADENGGDLTLVSKRRTGHHYDLDHANGLFYIRTNDNHVNFRVVSAPEDNPAEANWSEVIAGEDSDYIRALIAFKDFLAIQQRVGGIDQIRIRSYSGIEHFVAFPESVYAAGFGNTPEFESDTIRIKYESMITPETVYDYHVTGRKLETRKVQEIPSGYDQSGYETVRLMAPARDGVLVPVTLFYKKGLKKDSTNPLHLYGYGAYGFGMPPVFVTNAFSLVDRGFVYAIAHIRGGDEMGFQWYLDGKLEKRANTFNDFVDVARFLVEKNYTREGNISIEGRSAGGGLMGAVINQAPELWRVALVGVPFVDVLNTMLNDKLPLTPPEWPEWGNPITDKAAFELIKSYSPYDNIEGKDYPAQYVSGGLNDPRVTYWEPAKWTARMRALKTDNNPLVMKINMGAGHAGKTGRFTRLKERAEEYAFLLTQFGMGEEN